MVCGIQKMAKDYIFHKQPKEKDFNQNRNSNQSYRFSSFEFEWWSFIISNRVVLTPSDDTKWSAWANVTAIYRSGLTCDVTIRCTHFCQENTPKLFSSFSNTNDPLIRVCSLISKIAASFSECSFS